MSAGHIDRDAQITQQQNEVNYDGTYKNIFQTTNGIGYQEVGKGGVISEGVSQYYDPNGVLHERTWVADANGYRASGNDIPTPPPVPEYILRALEYIRLHPYKEPEHQKRPITGAASHVAAAAPKSIFTNAFAPPRLF